MNDRELTYDEAEALGYDGTGRDGDPRFPYHVSDLTESQVIALRARIEYENMSPEEQAAVDREWAETPDWRKDDLRAEIELDLL